MRQPPLSFLPCRERFGGAASPRQSSNYLARWPSEHGSGHRYSPAKTGLTRCAKRCGARESWRTSCRSKWPRSKRGCTSGSLTAQAPRSCIVSARCVAGADSPTGTGPLGAHRGDATEPTNWTFHRYPTDHLSGASPGLVLVNQAVAYDHRRWDYGSTIAVTLTGPYSICHWVRGQSEPESQFGERST